MARSRGLRARSPLRVALMTSAAVGLALASPGAQAAPKGGAVKGGQAEIVTRGNVTTIRQGGKRLVIDWASFDIAADEVVEFLQPGRSAIALNRILDGMPTHIRGKLTANGNVWLANPSGVYFHAGSVIDVGGLIATTADLSPERFMAGDHRFVGRAKPGAKVVNEGEITFAEAGLAALVAPHAENRGVIAGKLGKIVIAGQESLSVDVTGEGLIEIDLRDAAPVEGARAINSGLLSAEDGIVVITAAAVRDAVEAAVSVGGVVAATSARVEGGTIVLDGGAGRVEVSGTLDATGRTGGAVDVTGGAVQLTRTAQVDVSGREGGGRARIGGGIGGKGLHEARAVAVERGAEIRADATRSGDGGEVAIWSGTATWMGGDLSARGAGAGDGGFAEISSRGGLRFDGTADLGAVSGAAGMLLLDPRDVRIVGPGQGGAALAGDILASDGAGADFVVDAGSVSGAAADVRIQATRDLSVEARIINRRPTVDLTLEAGRDLILAADVEMTGALTLRADAPVAAGTQDGDGAIRVMGTVSVRSSFDRLTMTAAEGIDGSAMAATDVLTLGSRAGLALPATMLEGGLSASVNGGFTAAAVSARSLTISSYDGVSPMGGALRAGVAIFGKVAVSGDVQVETGGGSVILGGPSSVFAGAVAVNTAGGYLTAADVTLRTGGALELGAVRAAGLTVSAGGALTQSGAVSAGTAFLTASDIALGDAANRFAGTLSLLGGGDAEVAAAGAVRLGQATLASLDLTAGGAVTQAAGSALDLGGATVTTAGAAVTLANAGNAFAGAVSVDTGAGRADVALTTAGALALGDVRALGLTVGAGGDVTGAGAVDVAADATVHAFRSLGDGNAATGSFGDVTLTGAGSRIGGTLSATGRRIDLALEGDARLADVWARDGLSVSATGNASLTRVASGGGVASGDRLAIGPGADLTVAAAGGDVALRDVQAGRATLGGAGTVAGAATAARSVSVSDAILSGLETGALSGALTVTDAAVSGAADLGAAGTATLRRTRFDAGVSVEASGAVTLDGVRAPEVAATGAELRLGYVAADLLFLSATGDVRTDASAVAEDLSGGWTVVAEGPAAPLTDAGDAAVVTDGTATLGAFGRLVEAGEVAVSADGNLTLTAVDAGFGPLELDLGAVSAFLGGAAKIEAATDLALGFMSATGLRVSAGGDVRQTAEAEITGAVSVTAAGDVTLGERNIFRGPVSVAAQDALVRTQGDLHLRDVQVAGNLTAESGVGGLLAPGSLVALRVEKAQVGGALVAASWSGGVALADVQAGSATLGGAGTVAGKATAASGDVKVARAALGTLTAAGGDVVGFDGVQVREAVIADALVTGARNLTLEGVSLGEDAAFDPGAVEGTLTLSRVRIAGDLDIAVAGDVRLGLVEAGSGAVGAGDVDIVAAGSILKLADADLGADGPGRLTLDLGSAGTTVLDAPALGLWGDLLAASGDMRLSAGRDVLLPGAGALRVRLGGPLTLIAGRDAAISVTGDAALAGLAAGRAAAIETAADGAEAGDLTQTGAVRAGILTVLAAGDADLGRTDNALETVSGRVGGALTVRDADGFAVEGLRAGALTAAADGAVALRDGRVAGAATVRAAEVTAARLHLGSGALTAAGALAAEDVAAAGDLALTAGGDLSAARVSADALTAEAGGDARVTDATFVSADLRSLGGDLALTRLAGGTLAAQAGAGATAQDLDVGALRLDAAGDLVLSRLSADGAEVEAGAAAEVRSATVADAMHVVSGAGMTLAGVSAGTLTAEAGADFTAEDLSFGAATVQAGTDLSLLRAQGDTLAATSGGASSIAELDVAKAELTAGGQLLAAGVRGGTLQAQAGGALALRDAEIAAVTLASVGDMALERIVAGSLVAESDAGLLARKVEADDLALAAAKGMDLLQVSGGDAAASAGGDLTGAAIRGDRVALTAGGALTVEDLSAAKAELEAGGRLSLADAEAGTLEATAGTDAVLLRVEALGASVEAGRDLSAEAGAFGVFAGRAARDLAIADTTAEALTAVAGGALSATDFGAGAAELEAAGALSLRRGAADRLTATSGAAMSVREVDARRADLASGGALTVADASFGDASATAATDLRLTRVDAGALDLAAGGDLALARVEVSGALAAEARALSAADVQAAELRLAAKRGLKMERALVAEDANLRSGDAASVSHAAVGGRLSIAADLDGSEAEALRLRDVRAGRLTADAGGTTDLDAVATTGDASLRARRGDLLLGAVEIGGDLKAVADAGAILTQGLRRHGRRLRPRRRLRAGAPVPGGPTAPTTAGALGAAAGARTVGGHTWGNLLFVGGRSWFDAAGAVLLPNAPALKNDFRGAVSVTHASVIGIADANDLLIGAGAASLPGAGAVSRSGLHSASSVSLSAGGSVSDAAGAAIQAPGDLLVEAGGDVTLNSGRHDLGGAFSARGRNVTWHERGDVVLGPLSASGSLAVLAGAEDAPASILQTARIAAPALEMRDGAARSGTRTRSGALTVRGDADFATGAPGSRTATDLGADLRLADGRNLFGGDVSARRIFGDVVLVEESAEGRLALDANDAGALRIGALEAGGNILIRTSDDVILLGRLTSLRDDQTPAAAPQAPDAADAADWRAQGRAGIAEQDLHLFIADGMEFTVDTTAGGLDAAGGDIRFDRPIDGANRLSTVRDPQAVLARGGAGRVTLDAGRSGDVRFRDYVGAGAPVGRLAVLDARDVSLGHTFAARDPAGRETAGRFLLASPAEGRDLLVAGGVTIDARGAVEIHAPAGLLDAYEKIDDYYGLNTPTLTFGQSMAPNSLRVFGYIGNSGQRAAGLFPVGPRGPDYRMNGCVIGDVQDCTGVSAPRVLNIARVEQPVILNVEEEDLLELFVSYGNEELWGVPPGYFIEVAPELVRGSGLGDDEDDEDGPDAGGARTGAALGMFR